MSRADSMQLLRVQVLTEAPIPIVVAAGEVDVLSVPLLDEALRQALAGDPATIAVDLTRVVFLDSSGLAVLARSARACPQPPRVVPSPQARRPIETTGMTVMLRLFDTLAQALAVSVDEGLEPDEKDESVRQPDAGRSRRDVR
ncbi:STAS domain-containing protein [Nocardia sp. NPDC057668]|uniref:STAS domain-containing protein n=1 Tax=Nocardia sp. NPDC057668 TaxID=3346202 RepID=UPI00366CF595